MLGTWGEFVIFASSQQPCEVDSIVCILQINRVVKEFVQGFSLLKLGIETRSYDSEILAHCWWGPIAPLPFLPLWWFRGRVRPFCPWAEWAWRTWVRNIFPESHTSVRNIHLCCLKSKSSGGFGVAFPSSSTWLSLRKAEQASFPRKNASLAAQW